MADPSAFDALLLDHANESRVPPLTPGLGRPGEVLLDLTDDGVIAFAREVDGLPLASPQQIYVDLARERGHGAEAADHLRRTLLTLIYAVHVRSPADELPTKGCLTSLPCSTNSELERC